MKFVNELPLDDDANGSSGWGRLDVHARRVRTLYMEPLRIKISPNIYLRIRALRDSPLLPGLKKIYIPNDPSLDLSSALFLASGSTLNMVQIYGNATSDRQFFFPFLSSLCIKSPGLSHLALCGVPLSASVEPIFRFTELQSLEIRLCDPRLHLQLLHKLGQLPHLLDLIIDTGSVASVIQPHPTPISFDNSKFRQLKHLQIFGTTASINCILDELKGSTNLIALKIDRVSETSGSAWGSFFEVISTFSAVEDIEIFNRPRDSIEVSASSLAPLLKLENLKSFVINFNMVFSNSDDDFRVLAGGFPKLKKFGISVPPLPTDMWGIFRSDRGRTLACLYHLSQGCPDLREIRIAPSSNISDNLDAIKRLPHPIVRNNQHPLEKLYIDSDFGHLQPIQLVQVARFLDLIFPNLTTLETDNSKTTEAENWAGIHELRLALQDARINPSWVSDINGGRRNILLKDFQVTCNCKIPRVQLLPFCFWWRLANNVVWTRIIYVIAIAQHRKPLEIVSCNRLKRSTQLAYKKDGYM